jgi:hypothetical protein
MVAFVQQGLAAAARMKRSEIRDQQRSPDEAASAAQSGDCQIDTRPRIPLSLHPGATLRAATRMKPRQRRNPEIAGSIQVPERAIRGRFFGSSYKVNSNPLGKISLYSNAPISQVLLNGSGGDGGRGLPRWSVARCTLF